jgi:hypothetical protein
MKTINYILSALVSLMLVTSCDKDDLVVVLNESLESTLSTSSSSVELDKEAPDATALTLNWTAPDFGFNAAAYYKLLMSDVNGAMQSIANTSETSKSFSVSELNKTIVNLGFEAGTQASVSIELQTIIGAQDPKSLASTSVEITTYATVLDLSTEWGVVGSGTPNGWGGPDIPFYGVQGNPNAMVAYANLVDGEIKFRTNNAWDYNMGDDGADGFLEQNGANIAVSAGSYKITITLENGTPVSYSIEVFSWGVIGSGTANGWDSDFDLTYDSYTDTFKAVATLSDGEIKFRMNDDWAVNYGDSGADGVLDAGGDNIAVSAGNYLITLNLNDLTYSVEAIDIWGIIGSATANGWDSDTDMLYDVNNKDAGIWYINGITLSDGEIKFRANDDWAVNYGDNGADGVLDAGGDNIAVSAGTYNIVLNLSDAGNPTYTISAQ